MTSHFSLEDMLDAKAQIEALSKDTDVVEFRACRKTCDEIVGALPNMAADTQHAFRGIPLVADERVRPGHVLEVTRKDLERAMVPPGQSPDEEGFKP